MVKLSNSPFLPTMAAVAMPPMGSAGPLSKIGAYYESFVNNEAGHSDLWSPLAELSFECQNLPNLDIVSKTDPQVFVYMADPQGRWNPVGSTEVIRDNLNPKFAKSITCEYVFIVIPKTLVEKLLTLFSYYFEEVQKLRVVVCDIDKPGTRMEDQDFVGEITCTIGDIMGHRGMLTKPLINPKRNKNGTIVRKFVLHWLVPIELIALFLIADYQSNGSEGSED